MTNLYRFKIKENKKENDKTKQIKIINVKLNN